MILKEAYRYQNYLQRLISSTERMLSNRTFVTITKQEHLRKKANSDANDETIILPKPDNEEYSPMDIINFLVKAIEEKEKLSLAIESAKKDTSIDMDAAMSMNRVKQDFISCLSELSKIKSSETKRTGIAYTFNVNKEQVAYQYDIKEVTTIDYNRDDVKKLIKKYKKETDDISNELDRLMIITEVNYSPIWDIDTPFEDILSELK